jgi:hypothetical protein
MCLVRDIPTAGALVGALIGFNVFFSGLIVRPQYFKGAFELGYWAAPGRYAFEATVTTQFYGVDYKVIAEQYSPFYYNQNCDQTPMEECSGTMSEYVDFYFGGRFTKDNLGLDLGVLFFCLFLARLLCWVALRQFNYVNT